MRCRACLLVLRLLLWTLPRRHRRRFADEMTTVFARQCRDAVARRGTLAVLRLCARSWLDVLRTGLAMRFGSRRSAPSARHIPASRKAPVIDPLLQDIRYAGRGLRSRPGFATAAVLTLALGIGANAGVFSLLNALLFRALPGVSEPHRLVALYTGEGNSYGVSSLADFRDFEERVDAFAAAAAYKGLPMDLSLAGETRRIRGQIVTGRYFSALGVKAAAGRLLGPEDDVEPNGHPVVVLSWQLWQSRFGGGRDVVGEEISLNGRAFTIVGVAPDGFQGTSLGPARPLVFAPMMMQPHFMPASGDLLEARGWGGVDVIARLRDGVTSAQARAEVARVGEWLRETYPRLAGEREYEVVPLARTALEPSIRQPVTRLGMLLAAVSGVVLLVACVNVANLLLARTAARRREIAVRQAVGAARGRVARQLIVETVSLATLGGAAGLLLAHALLDGVRLLPLELPDGIALDVRVLAFTLGVSLLAGLLFGIVPALRATGSGLARRLRDSGDAGSRGTRRRGAGLLVTAQVALSMLLLVAAGLLGRTLLQLRTVELGFDPTGVAVMSVDPSLQGYDGAAVGEFYRVLLARSRALPGVEAVSLASTLPGPYDEDRLTVHVEGAGDDDPPLLGFTVVGVDYFRVLRLPIVRGRGFEPADATSSTRVAVVNRAAAEELRRRYELDVLGHRVSPGGPDEPTRIVGIAADSKTGSLRAGAAPMIYVLHPQVAEAGEGARMTLIARTEGDPRTMAASLRDALARVAPTVPAVDVGTLADHVAGSLQPERAVTILVGSAAALSLFLALVGLYGVLSYAVSRRSGELGVRMALGARTGDVRLLVIRQGLTLALVGILVGGTAALAASRLLESFLYGISAADPLTYCVTAAALLVTAGIAAWLPARRATRVDPVTALRAE